MNLMTSWAFLTLLMSGNTSNELLAVIDAEDYFAAQSLEAKADPLLDLARKEPATAQASVQQLLAIRWLGDNKVVKARDLLQQIAQGKTAQDRLGFAKEYAQRALDMIDGKPVATRQPPIDGLRGGLDWFPQDATFFAAAVLLPRQTTTEAIDLRRLLKLMPAEEKKEFYTFVNQVGNFRIDRVSFSYTHNPQDQKKSRIVVRFTGLGDHQRWAEFLRVVHKGENATVKESKGPQGEPITFVSAPNRPPALALIGDTELIMAGYEGNSAGDHLEVLQQILQIRAKGTGKLVEGKFLDTLKTVPDRANALAIGYVPESVREDFARDFERMGVGKAVPRNIAAHLVVGQGVNLFLNATMTNNDEARELVNMVAMLKKQAIEGLKNAQGPFKPKPDTVDLLTKTIEGIKAQAAGQNVKIETEISVNVLKAIHDMIEENLKREVKPKGN